MSVAESGGDDRTLGSELVLEDHRARRHRASGDAVIEVAVPVRVPAAGVCKARAPYRDRIVVR